MRARDHLLWLVIPLALACNALDIPSTPTPAPTAITSVKFLHFENEIVAFDYPEWMKLHPAGVPEVGWYPNIQLGGQPVVGLGDPNFFGHETYFRSIRIARRLLPTGSDPKGVAEETYARPQKLGLHQGVLDATGAVTIAGRPAYQKTYRVYSGEPAYELRDIWVQNQDQLLIISVWTEFTNREDLAAFQATADRLLTSLEIKDNPPEIRETPVPTATTPPTPVPLSMRLHFENDVVAFDYLIGWRTYATGDLSFVTFPDIPYGGELVAGVADPVFAGCQTFCRSIGVYRRPIASGSNFEKLLFDTYRQVEAKIPIAKGVWDATGVVEIAGRPAYQKTYRIFWGEPAYEFRDIWIQNGQEVFIVSMNTRYTNPGDIAVFQAAGDLFAASLKIKR